MPLKLFPPGTRKRNRYYVAKGRLSGVQHEFVCRDENGEKTADRRAAERCIRRFSAAVEAERQSREPSAGPVRTFGEGINAYILARGPSPNDRRYLDKLKEEIGELQLAVVVRNDLLAAGRALYPDARNETINRQVIAPGSAVLHYAADNEWAPYRRIRRLAEREPEIMRPAAGTLELLAANTHGKKRLLLLFLAHQGTRITETLGLRASHTDLQTGTYELYVSKSKGWQTLPLHDDMVAELANADPEADGYWFPWRTRSGVYKWLRPLCRKLNVRFTPHMARHEFGGGHREAGATSRDLVDIGSWTSQRSTERYQGAPTEHARAILHKARGIARGKAAK